MIMPCSEDVSCDGSLSCACGAYVWKFSLSVVFSKIPYRIQRSDVRRSVLEIKIDIKPFRLGRERIRDQGFRIVTWRDQSGTDLANPWRPAPEEGNRNRECRARDGQLAQFRLCSLARRADRAQP